MPPYTLAKNSEGKETVLTVENGKVFTANSSHPFWTHIKKGLLAGESVSQFSNIPQLFEDTLKPYDSNFNTKSDGVIYYNKVQVPDFVTQNLVGFYGTEKFATFTRIVREFLRNELYDNGTGVGEKFEFKTMKQERLEQLKEVTEFYNKTPEVFTEEGYLMVFTFASDFDETNPQDINLEEYDIYQYSHKDGTLLPLEGTEISVRKLQQTPHLDFCKSDYKVFYVDGNKVEIKKEVAMIVASELSQIYFHVPVNALTDRPNFKFFGCISEKDAQDLHEGSLLRVALLPGRYRFAGEVVKFSDAIII